ncbi:unnamed protein product, partial [Porites evermanni]
GSYPTFWSVARYRGLKGKIVNGEPTVTVRLNAAQKLQRNKQAGGGAYIPATIQFEGPCHASSKKAVHDRVHTSLAECENGGLMIIDIEN